MSTAVESLFEGVIAYVAELRALLEGTPTVEVDALEVRVKELCAGLNALPLEERLTHAAELAQLQESLGAFELDLRERRDQVRAQMASLNQSKSAHAAYRISDARDGGYKPGE